MIHPPVVVTLNQRQVFSLNTQSSRSHRNIKTSSLHPPDSLTSHGKGPNLVRKSSHFETSVYIQRTSLVLGSPVKINSRRFSRTSCTLVHQERSRKSCDIMRKVRASSEVRGQDGPDQQNPGPSHRRPLFTSCFLLTVIGITVVTSSLPSYQVVITVTMTMKVLSSYRRRYQNHMLFSTRDVLQDADQCRISEVYWFDVWQRVCVLLCCTVGAV